MNLIAVLAIAITTLILTLTLPRLIFDEPKEVMHSLTLTAIILLVGCALCSIAAVWLPATALSVSNQGDLASTAIAATIVLGSALIYRIVTLFIMAFRHTHKQQ